MTHIYMYYVHTHTHTHTHTITIIAPADYTDTVRLLTFGPSSVVDDPVAVPVNISADDLLEINETFSASLTLVPSSLITEILPSFATVTIDDDDRKYLVSRSNVYISH